MRTPKAFKPRPDHVDHQAMAPIRAIRRRMVTLLRSEQGMALPVALFAMVATMALASAAVLASLDVQQGSTRDNNSKKAIAAADAGAGVALLRLNRFKGSLSSATPCVGPAGEAQTPTGGWCPAITPEPVGKSSYSYMISAYQEGSPLSVVAVGTAGEVSRRIKVGLTTTEGENVFANEKLIGKDNVDLEGNFLLETDIGTNGEVHRNGSSGDVCGDVRHGPGKPGNVVPKCDGKVTEGEKELPEIVPPPGLSTSNSNCRLSWTCLESKEKDTYCKNNCSKPDWNPTTRTLSVSPNNDLTLGGQDYFICKLELSGNLIMAAGTSIRIFFDTPENCGMTAGAVRLDMGAQGRIAATGFETNPGVTAVPSIFMLGSKTIPTEVRLRGGSGPENEVILYAPNVTIDLNGNSRWNGMIAGKSLRIHGNPFIKTDPNIKPPDIEVETLFERTRYFECTGATGTPPDANC